MTTIYREPVMSQNQRLAARKDRWWVMHLHPSGKEHNTFVQIGYQPASDPLVCEIPDDGQYMIGAGEPDCYREIIDTTELGPQVAPCIRPGCAGVLHFLGAVPLPRCEPDETPYLRLCDACRSTTP